MSNMENRFIGNHNDLVSKAVFEQYKSNVQNDIEEIHSGLDEQYLVGGEFEDGIDDTVFNAGTFTNSTGRIKIKTGTSEQLKPSTLSVGELGIVDGENLVVGTETGTIQLTHISKRGLEVRYKKYVGNECEVIGDVIYGDITDAGKTLLSKIANSNGVMNLKITKVVIGDGEGVEHELALGNVELDKVRGKISFDGKLEPSSVKQGFFWKDTKIYTMHPDQGEILYNYAYNTKPDHIASSNGGSVEEILVSMIVTVGSNTTVDVTVDSAMSFATKQETINHIESIVHLVPAPTGSDDTQNLIEFFSHGYKNVKFREGVYNIRLDGSKQRESLVWFIDQDDINIYGENTTINDNTNYTNTILSNIFAFTRCKNVKIQSVNYVGVEVSNPEQCLNTTGATFAYFEDNCKNIFVDFFGRNLRYGVRTGDYRIPAYGKCKNLFLNIKGEMMGYPLCAYYADNVNGFVEVDGIHRGVYFAGVNKGDVISKCKNMYGEITHILLTNTIIEWNDNKDLRKVRGCRDVKVQATDNGSTKMLDGTMLVQISLSWVNPCDFENLDINFSINSSNGISDKVGGFAIQSTVKSVRPEYQFNFEPFITFTNIKVSGYINRLGQTTSTNSLGEIFLRTYDTGDTSFLHLPTINNIILENITYLKGSIQSRTFYLDTPNAENLIIKNCNFSGVNVSASAKKIIVDNTIMGNLTSYKTIDELNYTNSYIQSLDIIKILSIINTNNTISPFVRKTRTRIVSVQISGASSVNVNAFFKRGAQVKSVLARLVNYKTAGTWSFGIVGELDLLGVSTLNTSSGYNRFYGLNYKTNTFPRIFDRDTDLVITFYPTDVTTYPQGIIDLFIEEDIFDVI